MKFLAWILVFLAGWVTVASAHHAESGWEYPWQCCEPKRHCRSVPFDQIKVTPEGYILPSGELVPFNEANSSPDGEFHVCTYKDGSLRRGWQDAPAFNRSWKCFFAPEGAV